MITVTDGVRQFLKQRLDYQGALDDNEDTVRKQIAEFIRDGRLEVEDLSEVLSREHEARTKARAAIKSLLADDDSPPTAQELQNTLAEQERKLAAKFERENTMGTATSDGFMKMAVGANDSDPHIRVKGADEQYSTKRYIAKHAKFNEPVHARMNGVVSPSPIEAPSEWESAKLGAFLKYKAARAGLCSLSEHDRAVLDECLTKDAFVGWNGEQFVKTMQTKSLLNDDTSGGENLVPEFFDRSIVTFPLLHSEVLPFVDQVSVSRGSEIETASVGNPTVTWGHAEGTAHDLFDTAGLVQPITASVHPVAIYLRIGRDLMGDSLPNIGSTLMANIAQRVAQELDRVICNGNGSDEPEGILEASGTTEVPTQEGTSGPVKIDDLLDLMFAVGKQYRTPTSAARYIMQDQTYKKHRALATGVTGDDRLLHGMSVQNYQLLEAAVAIENEGLGPEEGIFGALRRYRLWRRQGFNMGFETGGETLVRSNTVLLHGRGRYAGKVVDPNAFAIVDDWPNPNI